MDLPFWLRVLSPVVMSVLLATDAAFTLLLAPASLLSPLIGNWLCDLIATIGESIEDQMRDFGEYVDSKAIK